MPASAPARLFARTRLFNGTSCGIGSAVEWSFTTGVVRAHIKKNTAARFTRCLGLQSHVTSLFQSYGTKRRRCLPESSVCWAGCMVILQRYDFASGDSGFDFGIRLKAP